MKLNIALSAFLFSLSYASWSTSAFHVHRLLSHSSPRTGTTTTTTNNPILETQLLPQTMKGRTSTSRFMFGNMFGASAKTSLDEAVTVYHQTVATDGVVVGVGSATNTDVAFEGLGDYLSKWSDMFTNGSISLTTPVQVKKSSSSSSTTTTTATTTATGDARIIRLLFQNRNTGYKSSKDEVQEQEDNNNNNNNNNNNDNKKKKKEASQGGVEIVVQRSNGEIQVVVQRCEIEEDTIIKEMSEETILSELKTAIEVWKRETKQGNE